MGETVHDDIDQYQGEGAGLEFRDRQVRRLEGLPRSFTQATDEPSSDRP